MVENKIIQTIYLRLKKYLCEDNIKFYPSNNLLKFVIEFKDCYIEILFHYIDNFYQIRIENRHINQLQYVIFLTKSKAFHKDIQCNLKENNFKQKSFENHMACFANILSNILDSQDKLIYLEEKYSPNLKFDGIYI